MARFYRNTLPNDNDLVMVKIVSYSEQLGYYGELLEYSNKKCFVALSELVGRKMYKKHIFTIGQTVPLQVIGKDNECVNLSRKRIDENEIIKFKKNFDIYSQITKLVKEIDNLYHSYCENNNRQRDLHLEDLMENIVWSQIDNIEPDNMFSHILTNRYALLDNVIEDDVKKYILNNVEGRIIHSHVKIELKLSLTVIDVNAIEKIRDILDIQKYICTDIPVSVHMISPPHYLIKFESDDEQKGAELLEYLQKEMMKKFDSLGLNEFSKINFDNFSVIKSQSFSVRFLNEKELGDLIGVKLLE